jgi:hypothetical protein
MNINQKGIYNEKIEPSLNQVTHLADPGAWTKFSAGLCGHQGTTC